MAHARTNPYRFILGLTTRLGLTCLLFLAWPMAMQAQNVVADGGHEVPERIILNVEGPRPLAMAIKEVNRAWGLAITYEDPRYSRDDLIQRSEISEAIDPTARRGSQDKLVPRIGRIELELSDPTASEEDVARALIDAHELADNAGSFDVVANGGFTHVVPKQPDQDEGDSPSAGSILDRQITLSHENISVYRALEAVLREAGAGYQTHLNTGTLSWPQFLRENTSVHAENEVARDVLVRILRSLPQAYTWLLYYGSDSSLYVLNLKPIRDPVERSHEERSSPDGLGNSSGLGTLPTLVDLSSERLDLPGSEMGGGSSCTANVVLGNTTAFPNTETEMSCFIQNVGEETCNYLWVATQLSGTPQLYYPQGSSWFITLTPGAYIDAPLPVGV